MGKHCRTMATEFPPCLEFQPDEPLRPRGRETKAYVGATFDIFHAGHVFLLMHAKRLADHVVAVLNTDEFVEKFKGHKPIMTLADRLMVLSACKFVDEIDVNVTDEDSMPMIAKHKPDYVVFGDDYTVERYYKQMGFSPNFLSNNNIQLVRVRRAGGWSSTQIREAVLARGK